VEGQVVYLENKKGVRQPFTVKSCRAHKDVSIVSLHGVEGIEEAEKFVGAAVYVAKDELEDLAPDEFYWHQLIGLTVKTEEGIFLGRLEEIFPTGSNDVFVVRKNGQEILLPATDEVVVQVDLEKKIMIVRPLEGMLPENDF